MHKRYFEGLLQQVQATHDNTLNTYSAQQYMDMRALTIGAYPAIALAEYVDEADGGFAVSMLASPDLNPLALNVLLLTMQP